MLPFCYNISCDHDPNFQHLSTGSVMDTSNNKSITSDTENKILQRTLITHKIITSRSCQSKMVQYSIIVTTCVISLASLGPSSLGKGQDKIVDSYMVTYHLQKKLLVVLFIVHDEFRMYR